MSTKFNSIIDNNPGRAIAMLANLVPLIGVVFFHWDPKRIFTVYCLETIIIGFFTVLKMFLVGTAQGKHVWNDANDKKVYAGTLVFVFFFIFHYGLFVTVQTSMFFALADIGNISPFSGYRELFAYLQNREIIILLATFITSYAISDFGVFVINQDYKTEPMGLVMFSPYGRIFIQQFVVILGGFLLHFFNGALFMCVFIVTKIFVENYLRFDDRIREAVMKNFKKE